MATLLPSSRTGIRLQYCHDTRRALQALDGRHDAMIDSAFTGLKQLFYAGGMANNCRGTSTGVTDYYRTRPMGFGEKTLFAAGLARRHRREG